MTAPLFWPAPLAFDDSPAVLELQTLTGDPDAAIYALRLWHHARRCGFDTLLSAGALERVATNGRPKKGRLLKALVEAGIVAPVESSNHYMIIPWQDCAVVEWTRPGEDAADDDADTEPEEDAKERRRRLDRERKLRKRSGHDADNSADSADSEADISAVEADTKRTDADKDPVNGRYSPRAPARATETETQTETDTETSEDQKPFVGLQNPTPDLFGDAPRQDAPSKAELEERTITEVLTEWRTASGMSRAHIEGPMAKKRRTRIRARLREGWTLDDLSLACIGMTRDAFLMGTDPRSKDGGYRDVETVFRDASQVERLIALAKGDVPKKDAPKPSWQVQEVVRKPDYFVAKPPVELTPEQEAAGRAAIAAIKDKLAGRAPAEASDGHEG